MDGQEARIERVSQVAYPCAELETTPQLIPNLIVIRLGRPCSGGVRRLVTRKRIAVTSVVTLVSVMVALALPAYVPAVTSVNSHSMQVQCTSWGAIVSYPSSWVTNSNYTVIATNGIRENGTSMIINFPPSLVSTFNYTEHSGNVTIWSRGTLVNLSNNTDGVIIHTWNSTSCSGIIMKG